MPIITLSIKRFIISNVQLDGNSINILIITIIKDLQFTQLIEKINSVPNVKRVHNV